MKKFWREYSIYFTSPSGNLQKIFMFFCYSKDVNIWKGDI
jgi:hypothetical protein